MIDDNVRARARQLRSLHEGPVLVLPNAWDAASAVLIAAAGARAIATTSAGVAWTLGRADGEGLARTEMVDAIRRIASVVDLPVSADIEGGYGPDPADVATTVRAALDAGAVGVNLEDSRPADGSLFPAAQQGARLRAAREAAAGLGVADFVINARTDVFLRQVGDPAGRLDQVLDRAQDYATAGADVLFVPGLLDLRLLRDLVAASPLPVNAMAAPNGPTIAELSAAGVRRVSLGAAIASAAYSLVQHATREVLEAGTYATLAATAGHPDLDARLG